MNKIDFKGYETKIDNQVYSLTSHYTYPNGQNLSIDRIVILERFFDPSFESVYDYVRDVAEYVSNPKYVSSENSLSLESSLRNVPRSFNKMLLFNEGMRSQLHEQYVQSFSNYPVDEDEEILNVRTGLLPTETVNSAKSFYKDLKLGWYLSALMDPNFPILDMGLEWGANFHLTSQNFRDKKKVLFLPKQKIIFREISEGVSRSNYFNILHHDDSKSLTLPKNFSDIISRVYDSITPYNINDLPNFSINIFEEKSCAIVFPIIDLYLNSFKQFSLVRNNIANNSGVLANTSKDSSSNSLNSSESSTSSEKLTTSHEEYSTIIPTNENNLPLEDSVIKLDNRLNKKTIDLFKDKTLDEDITGLKIN